MAGVKISNLTSLLTTPQDSAVLPIVDSGITKKITVGVLKTLIPPGSGAKGASGNLVFWENPTNVTGSYSITTGQNAGSFGPITINAGVIVTVPSGSVWTVI
jgi:hypothetical protein